MQLEEEDPDSRRVADDCHTTLYYTIKRIHMAS